MKTHFLIKLKAILIISLVLIITVVFIVLFNNYIGSVNCEVNTYDLQHFPIVSCRGFKSHNNEHSDKFNGEENYIIDMPQKDIIAEFVSISSNAEGNKPNNSSYYVVLYNNRKIYYVKGCLAAKVAYSSDSVEQELINRYNNDSTKYTILSAYENHKRGSKILTKKQYLNIIDRLNTVEKYYPYKNEFSSKTGKSHYGCFYNGHYYNILGITKIKEADDSIYNLMIDVGKLIDVEYLLK